MTGSADQGTSSMDDGPTGDEAYRGVIDGAGTRTGTVASSPMTQDAAMAGRDQLVEIFARDMAADDFVINVLDGLQYALRAEQGRGGRGDG